MLSPEPPAEAEPMTRLEAEGVVLAFIVAGQHEWPPEVREVAVRAPAIFQIEMRGRIVAAARRLADAGRTVTAEDIALDAGMNPDGLAALADASITPEQAAAAALVIRTAHEAEGRVVSTPARKPKRGTVAAQSRPDPGGDEGEDESPATRRTHLGNARRLVELAARPESMVVFDPAAGWRAWDGHCWRPGRDFVVQLLAQAIPEAIRAEADQMARAGVDSKEVGRHRRWAHNSEGAGVIAAAMRLAQPHLDIRHLRKADGLRHDEPHFDRDPHVLNCPNGIVDLRSGELRQPDPRAWHSKSTGVPYDPRAECGFFIATLELFQPDPVMREYLQRALGSACLGVCVEQEFFINYAPGANGKSTILNAAREALGDYGAAAGIATFTDERRQGSGPSPDRARLLGVRFLTVAEAEGRRLDVGFIKQATGGDPVTARHLHREPVEFRLTARFFFLCNARPEISDPSNGMWRRVRLIPWPVTLPKERQINPAEVEARLRNERPGILRWLVEGAGKALRDGLNPPPAVGDATEQYRLDEDALLGFLAEAGFETGHSGALPQTEVTEAWAAHRENNPRETHKVGGKKKMLRQLCDRFGVVQEKRGDVRWLLGICRTGPASDGKDKTLPFCNSPLSDPPSLRDNPKTASICQVAPPEPVPETPAPCRNCRQRRWWRSVSGSVICATCHPPANDSHVAAWLGEPAEPLSPA